MKFPLGSLSYTHIDVTACSPRVIVVAEVVVVVAAAAPSDDAVVVDANLVDGVEGRR